MIRGDRGIGMNARSGGVLSLFYIHTSNRRISILKGQFIDINFLFLTIVVSDGALIWLWHLSLLDGVHHTDDSFSRFRHEDCEGLAAMDGTNCRFTHDSICNGVYVIWLVFACVHV